MSGPAMTRQGPAPAAAAIAEVSEAAVRAFEERHPDLVLAPVVIVIPALDEAQSVGGVLDGVAPEACGLAVDVLVVDDGSTDGTMERALEHGAHVARLERNCGQGAAFRVGYRIAREHGARYLVTLDADGQWDPADVPRVLEPVVSGEADFVLGSRVLGSADTQNRLRRAGVGVFSAVVRRLSGVDVTDTSSGLRAFRAEVSATVPQSEPQYQAAELLLGAILQGYRIAERPVVMHRRTAGVSKKGHNVLYGARYARVIARTWWRGRGGSRRRAATG
jgi:glycosyltransferase involved in cell wall biosynthesis